MRGINRVFLVGHVGQDPELRTTANGRTLCDVSLATNRSTRDGESWKQVTDWHRVVFWEKQAEICGRFVRKGTPIGVEGELRLESWTDRSGMRRTRTKVVGTRLHLLGKPNREQAAPIAEATTEPSTEAQSIPF